MIIFTKKRDKENPYDIAEYTVKTDSEHWPTVLLAFREFLKAGGWLFSDEDFAKEAAKPLDKAYGDLVE